MKNSVSIPQARGHYALPLLVDQQHHVPPIHPGGIEAQMPTAPAESPLEPISRKRARTDMAPSASNHQAPCCPPMQVDGSRIGVATAASASHPNNTDYVRDNVDAFTEQTGPNAGPAGTILERPHSIPAGSDDHLTIAADRSQSFVPYDKFLQGSEVPWDLNSSAPLQTCWGIYGDRPFDLYAHVEAQPLSVTRIFTEEWPDLVSRISGILDAPAAQDNWDKDTFWKHLYAWKAWCKLRKKSVIVCDANLAQFLAQVVVAPCLSNSPSVSTCPAGNHDVDRARLALIPEDAPHKVRSYVESLKRLRRVQDMFLDIQDSDNNNNNSGKREPAVGPHTNYVVNMVGEGAVSRRLGKGSTSLADQFFKQGVDRLYSCFDPLHWPFAQQVALNHRWLRGSARQSDVRSRSAHLLSMYGMIPSRCLDMLRVQDFGISRWFSHATLLDSEEFALTVCGVEPIANNGSIRDPLLARSIPLRRILRHKHVSLCAVGALATHLVEFYSDCEIHNRLPYALDFKGWACLLPFSVMLSNGGGSSSTHLHRSQAGSGGGENANPRSSTLIDYESIGIETPALSDWEMKLGQRLAGLSGPTPMRELADPALGSVGAGEADSYLIRLAGFGPHEEYSVPRGEHLPPASLLEMVFPWLDAAMAQLRVHNQVTHHPPPHASYHKTVSINVCVELHLHLLKWLRVVFLQDWALLQRLFPSHPVLEHPVFKTSEWQAFSDLFALSDSQRLFEEESRWFHYLERCPPDVFTGPGLAMGQKGTVASHDRLESLEELKASIAASRRRPSQEFMHPSPVVPLGQQRQQLYQTHAPSPLGAYQGHTASSTPVKGRSSTSVAVKPQSENIQRNIQYLPPSLPRVIVKPLNRSSSTPVPNAAAYRDPASAVQDSQSRYLPDSKGNSLPTPHNTGNGNISGSPSRVDHTPSSGYGGRNTAPYSGERSEESALSQPIDRSPALPVAHPYEDTPSGHYHRRQPYHHDLELVRPDKKLPPYEVQHTQELSPNPSIRYNGHYSHHYQQQQQQQQTVGHSVPRILLNLRNSKDSEDMDRASNTHSHISSEPTRSKLEVASNIAERYVLPDGEVIIKPRIKQLSEIETLVEMWVDFCNVWKFIEAHRSNNLEGHPLNKIEKKRMWEWRRMIEEVLYTLAHRKKEPMPHTQRQQLWTPELYSRFNEIKEMCATLDIERSKLHPSSRRWGTFKKHLVYLRNGGGDDRGRDNGNETSHSEA